VQFYPHVDAYRQQPRGAKVLLTQVGAPERCGIAALDEEQTSSTEEQPKGSKSSSTVDGCFMYDQQVFDLIGEIAPSTWGELEITAVNNLMFTAVNLSMTLWKGAGQTQAPLNHWKKQIAFYSVTKTRSSVHAVIQ